MGLSLAACDVVTPQPAATETPAAMSTRTATATPTPMASATPAASSTPTASATASATATARPLPTQAGAAGGFLQYDWPCPYALTSAVLPDGRRMDLCPSGLNVSVNPATYKDTNAFRDGAGMNWTKLAATFPLSATVPLGGMMWVAWRDINPGEGMYNWAVIDTIVAAAKQQGKPVMFRLYDLMSNRPSKSPPVSAIDGGFIFDDATPDYVKRQITEPVPGVGR